MKELALGTGRPRRLMGAGAFIAALALSSPLLADEPAAKAAPAAPAAAPAAITTVNPEIDLGDLKLIIEPLTKGELELEANSWFDLLRKKVREVSEAELAVRRKNREIAALDKVKAAAENVAAATAEAKQEAAAAPPGSEEAKAAAAKLAETNAALARSVEDNKKQAEENLQQAAAISQTPASGASADGKAPNAAASTAPAAGGAAPAPEASEEAIMKRAAESAQKKAEKTGDASAVADTVAAAINEKATDKELETLAKDTPAAAQAAAAQTASAQPAAPVVEEAAKKAETLAAKADEAAAAKSDAKVQLVDFSTQLASERTALTDRLKLVLDNLELKGGKAEDMRQYMAAVGGLNIDVTDQTATVARLKSWLLAEEGGMRWARNLGIFLGYVLGSVVVAWIVRGIFSRVMKAAGVASQLLTNFVVNMSGRVVIFAGILAGLSALEVNLAPLIAVIGAAGFVVAFALQGTLSNFASGLLIMVNKPFDVGDDVEAGGIRGRVSEVSIFSTVVHTEEGTKKIIPNNSIWGGVIVNYTTGAVTKEGEPTDEAPAPKAVGTAAA